MRKYSILLAILLSAFSILLFSCNRFPDAVPFPEEESEFLQPPTEKIEFTESKKLNWITLTSDSIKPPVEKPFSFDKLASKPVFGLNAMPLLHSMQTKKFIWEDLSYDVFNWDSIPEKKLVFETSILGQPIKVKAGYPRLKDGATKSILLFGQDQGLSGTVVVSFSQEKNGNLWIATDNGLNRFDGEYFEIYTRLQGLSSDYKTGVFTDSKGQIWSYHISPSTGLEIIDQHTKTLKHIGKTEGLSNDGVTGILEDNEGRIWVSTWNGLNVLNEKKGTIRNIKRTKGNRQDIPCIMEDKEGRIWTAIPRTGIDVIDEKAGKILHIDSTNGLSDNNIQTMAENIDGQIWIGTSSGVEIIDITAGTISRLNTKNDLTNGGYNVSSITFDKQGMAWIGISGGGVDVFDPANKTIKHLNSKDGLSNDDVQKVFIDAHGQAWIGLSAGEINIYDPNAGNLQHFTAANGFNNKSAWFYALAEDKKNRKWIGTLGEGIDLIDEGGQTIQHISMNEGLFSNIIYKILIDRKERIWIGTDLPNREINVIDEKSGIIKSFGVEQGFRFRGHAAMLEDKKGKIWIGKGALLVYNDSNKTIRYITTNEGLNDNWITDIIQDDDDDIWIASETGVSVIDAETNTIKIINNDKLRISIVSMMKDSRGLIWICTYGNGLIMADKRTGVIKSFAAKEGLTDRVALSAVERKGSIYAGTGKGLSVLTPDSSGNLPRDLTKWKIRSYGKPQGFLRVDHNPQSMLSKDGKLWFTIADVLTVMEEPLEDNVVPMPRIIGLDIMEKPQYFVNRKWRQERLKDIDTVWSTSVDTFYLKNSLPPDSDYLQKNQITWDSINFDGIPYGLTLPYDQNHLTFTFTGTHLDNLNKTRYRYILEGNDKSWSGITDNSFADYRNLSPGKYVFKVRAKGFNGLWSQEAVMRFIILPPLWQTWWAYSLYVLISAIMVWLLVRYRSRHLKAQNLRLEHKVIVRTNELKQSLEDLKSTQAQLIQSEKMASLGELTAGIAHEIQNPLNFVNNFSEVNTELIGELEQEALKGNIDEVKIIAKDIKENSEKINHHGKRADAIIKGMLQHSRTSSGIKEATDINALCEEYLRLTYHGLRAKDKSFNAKFETDFDPTVEKINVVPQEIGRVILNLINNAFYAVSEKKKMQPDNYEPIVTVATQSLKASAAADLGVVEIKVKDNGNGISQKIMDKIFQPFFTTKPTGQGTGLGLSLSYDIVKAHGGELKVDTEEGKFTEFVIHLPLNKNM